MRHPSRILFVQLRRLGDVVLSTPLLADLRRAYPEATIDVLTGAAAAPMLRNNPDINEVLHFDPSRMLTMLRMVRAGNYDWLVDVQGHPRTAITALLSGIPVRAGWDLKFWGFAYTHRAPRTVAPPMYSGRNRQRLLEVLGVVPGSPLPRLYLSDAEVARGGDLLRGIGAPRDRPLVGLVLTAADERRNWSAQGFAAVADQLHSLGCHVIVFRFPGDASDFSAFRKYTSAAQEVGWHGDREFLAVLSHLHLLVSPNTGPSHMATALGVPRVTVCDSLSATTWVPETSGAAAVWNTSRRCMGCEGGRCPVARECILGVTPDQVVAAALDLLRTTPPETRSTPQAE